MINSDFDNDDHATRNEHEEYRVGYRNPPRQTRFKPGQSGNPKGRPKGTRSLSAQMHELLSQKMPVREGNSVKRITMRDALLRTTLKAALNGDHRARQDIFVAIRECELRESKMNAGADHMVSEEDQAILAGYNARIRGAADDDET
jgi:hypothetical protein